MPLTRISMRRGKSPEYRKAVMNGVYEALLRAFDVPEDDKFLVLNEYDADNFAYSPSYLNVARSDDLILIQITANNTRSIEQKKALYARIVQILAENPGVRPEDVFINIVEAAKENWSFGNGVAQYA